MRHRRRLNTQTVRKRQPSAATHHTLRASRRSGSTGKFFKSLLYLIIFAGIMYAGYRYLLPLISFPSTETSETVSTVRDPLPAETKPEAVAESKPQLSPLKKRIQIEVLNGCGEQGIAKILGSRLLKEDYDIVNSGNYIEKGKTKFDVKQTKIIDQLKTPENLIKAKDLARLIGIKTAMVESFENPSPIADITIVIGQDFKTLPVLKKD